MHMRMLARLLSSFGFVMFLGIHLALADTAAAPTAPAAAHAQGNPWSMLLLPVLLIVVFYFLMMRPQMKRAKEHRQLVEHISIGDEVATNAGIVGRVARLRDNFIGLEISRGTEITIQKNAIASVLPKGTIDNF